MQLILNASWCKAGATLAHRIGSGHCSPPRLDSNEPHCVISPSGLMIVYWRPAQPEIWNIVVDNYYQQATTVSPLQLTTPEGLLFSNLKRKILEFLSTTTWYGKSFNESQNTDGPEWWLMWSFSSFNVKDIHCPFSPLIILVQEATPVFFISRLFRVFHQVHWFQNLGSSVFARRSSAPLYFRIFSSTDNSRPLLMIQALSVSSEPRCTAVRRSKAPLQAPGYPEHPSSSPLH